MSSLDKTRPSTPTAPQDERQLAGRDRQQVALGGTRLPDSPTRSNPRTTVFRHHWILWAGPVVMLVAALLPWPYGYYNFLRFCVCGAASFLAYQQWTHDDAASKWVVILGAIALLYNPLVPIHLTREIWTLLNVGTAMAFVGHFRSLRLLLHETGKSTRWIGGERSGRALVRRRR